MKMFIVHSSWFGSAFLKKVSVLRMLEGKEELKITMCGK